MNRALLFASLEPNGDVHIGPMQLDADRKPAAALLLEFETTGGIAGVVCTPKVSYEFDPAVSEGDRKRVLAAAERHVSDFLKSQGGEPYTPADWN